MVRDLHCAQLMNREDRQALYAGTLGDEEFDALLPEHARTKSQNYWTPLSVAMLVARRLTTHGATSVLDVGCGVGKFCIAAAAANPQVQWTGIDRRATLIDDAKALAARVGVENVRFLCGDALALTWEVYDGLYFFNPFSENLVETRDRLDGSVELSLARYLSEVRSNRVRTWRKTATPDASWVHVVTDGGVYCATSLQLEHALARW
jgi:SAM-dependent methyltransferase